MYLSYLILTEVEEVGENNIRVNISLHFINHHLM